MNTANFNGLHLVEHGDKRVQQWLNYSAFLARLLAGGVVEILDGSDLVHGAFSERSPSAKSGIDLTEDARRYEPHACGAAMWIIYAGDALFEMCEEDTDLILAIEGRDMPR